MRGGATRSMSRGDRPQCQREWLAVGGRYADRVEMRNRASGNETPDERAGTGGSRLPVDVVCLARTASSRLLGQSRRAPSMFAGGSWGSASPFKARTGIGAAFGVP